MYLYLYLCIHEFNTRIRINIIAWNFGKRTNPCNLNRKTKIIFKYQRWNKKRTVIWIYIYIPLKKGYDNLHITINLHPSKKNSFLNFRLQSGEIAFVCLRIFDMFNLLNVDGHGHIWNVERRHISWDVYPSTNLSWCAW